LAEEDDLMGREIGEALWPERWDADRLKAKKKSLGSYAWSSLYQQMPYEMKAGMVQREWFSGNWYNGKLPPGVSFYGGIDTATSRKSAGHDSSLAEVAQDREGFIYVHSGFSGQVSVKALAELVCSHQTTRRFSGIKIELNNAGEAIKQRIEEIGRERGSYPPITGETAIQDKVARLLPWTPLIENGTIKWNMTDEWVVELVENLIKFSAGDDYDDVDALVWALVAVADRQPDPSFPSYQVIGVDSKW
jgi:predicted phage terminase large subunit-like protein